MRKAARRDSPSGVNGVRWLRPWRQASELHTEKKCH
ncbi:unnamed protein product [Ixodes pacificus]